jgi:hypothetical protein
MNAVDHKVLLEYANGTITTVDANNWQLTCPELVAY